jgi:hypothetical protein
MSLHEINRALASGEVPEQLSYGRLTFAAIAKRFPPGWEYTPGFEQIIQQCIPQQTPLEFLSSLDDIDSNGSGAELSDLPVVTIGGCLQIRTSVSILQPASDSTQ